MRNFKNDYNPDGKQKRQEARERVGNKCYTIETLNRATLGVEAECV
jgi:hypothetical protein